MNQPPPGFPQQPMQTPQHPGSPLPSAPHPAYAPHTASQRTSANIAVGIIAIIWAGAGFIGHTIMTMYLMFGVTITHTLGGVFGRDANGIFNWAVLLIALIGQLLGLALSVIAMIRGFDARKKRMRRGTAAMVLGIVATAIFLVIGLFQLPLVSVFFDALSLVFQ